VGEFRSQSMLGYIGTEYPTDGQQNSHEAHDQPTISFFLLRDVWPVCGIGINGTL
jgi:hypothetical protein